MRQIGKRSPTQLATEPTAEALHLAAIHQRTGNALAALPTMGMAKGIYRFPTHEAMNRHSDEALARAIAENVRARAGK